MISRYVFPIIALRTKQSLLFVAGNEKWPLNTKKPKNLSITRIFIDVVDMIEIEFFWFIGHDDLLISNILKEIFDLIIQANKNKAYSPIL